MASYSVDATAVDYVKEGKLRILAFWEKKMIPGFENLPSLQELYGVVMPNVNGVWGPKGLPEPVVNRLEDAYTKAMKDPDFVGLMARFYNPIVYMNRSEFNKYVETSGKQIGDILKRLLDEEAKGKK